MNYLDWLVIIFYIVIIIGLALYLTAKQKNTQDYYLAGRKIKWWQSGVSTMATQLSAISFVSAPAFVAIKQGGGLKWLDVVAVKIGIISGILLNLFLWQFTTISWMWWNVTGFLASVFVAVGYSLFFVKVTEPIKLN